MKVLEEAIKHAVMEVMTLDEAIRHAEEVAEENQRVVDTGIVFNDVTIDTLYCGDSEVIEEHIANYQECAKKYRRLAEWLKELKGYRSIKDQIAFAKRNIRSENSDYLTGYISALSAVEGMIAEVENAESEE